MMSANAYINDNKIGIIIENIAKQVLFSVKESVRTEEQTAAIFNRRKNNIFFLFRNSKLLK